MGRKLYACFLAAGIARPQLVLVQSTWIQGEGKTLAWSTLRAASEAVVSEGVASENKVAAACAALQDFTANPHTLICGPRVFQPWSRPSAYRPSSRHIPGDNPS